jgi:hypothetical protein
MPRANDGVSRLRTADGRRLGEGGVDRRAAQRSATKCHDLGIPEEPLSRRRRARHARPGSPGSRLVSVLLVLLGVHLPSGWIYHTFGEPYPT